MGLKVQNLCLPLSHKSSSIISKSFVLLQQFDNGVVEQIKMKIANTIPGLINAEALVVGQTSEGIWSKAPSIFYHNEAYWILSEGVENYPTEKNWNTYAYRSSNLEGPYNKVDNTLILTENTACPFPYVENGILYNFVCLPVLCILKKNIFWTF